jgi:ubiquinone/menaquinone biosynthesis C-methylase UbiE
MGNLLNIVTTLHESTSRNYVKRMTNDKANCMNVARKYGKDFWDGDRKFGYGGYVYRPGWWKTVAEELIQKYKLTNQSSVLDLGCGKAFLLHEIVSLLPGLRICGVDTSKYGLQKTLPTVSPYVFEQNLNSKLPFNDKEFNLVISINTFHNLKVYELSVALEEMDRVGENGYLVVESYRSEIELFNLQCWALTAEAFFDQSEWIWLFKNYGYQGDYEFIYFK